MKTFLSLVSALLILLGAGWLLFPESMLARWGAETDAMGVYVARRYGGLLLGYAAILWLGRASGPSVARTAILGGGAAVTALMTLLSLAGVFTGSIGPGGWVSVGIEGLLAAGFVTSLLRSRSQEGGAA